MTTSMCLKASDVIERLQALVAKHGDLPLYSQQGDGVYDENWEVLAVIKSELHPLDWAPGPDESEDADPPLIDCIVLGVN